MTTSVNLELIREDAEGVETIYDVEADYSCDPGSRPGCRIENAYPSDEQFDVTGVFKNGKPVVIELTEKELDNLLVLARETLQNYEEDEPIREDE